MAVGRSDKTLRLFVTCQDANKKTLLKMYDRNMNGELDSTVASASSDTTIQKDGDDGESSSTSKIYDKIVSTIISNNNMVYKQNNNVKTINFVEVA